MHLFVALGGVCVVDVGLVNPEGVAQYKPVLVAGYRGEHAAPSIEVSLVADATQLGRALDGGVETHWPNEGGLDGERLSSVPEDGAREGGEPPAAGAAAPSRDAGGGGAVPPGAAGTPARVYRPPRPRPSCPRQSRPWRRLSPTTSLSSRNSLAARPAANALKGLVPHIWICLIRPNAHLEGLSSPNKDPGGRSGELGIYSLEHR